ncbi:hypothetical protein LCGC14_0532040 [marine sediment metagenome]|uniref:Uncharacterized protein n=1 Tax=marine sediment metagenome TaxID=412755 RepID=A0A0F9UGT2_9ZZZZ
MNIIIEKLKIGYILRIIHGAYFNKKYPDFNLFKALALKSGLPGSKVFKFTTDGQEVTLFPMGQHLDQHGSDEITDLRSLRWDFEKPEGKISWITKFRLYERKHLSEFVKEGPIRIHYLPEAKCLAVGGGRNRLLTLMRLGYRNAMQLKQAEWDEANQKYEGGDIVINYPGKPVWDDIPPTTSKQGWVDKTKRWDDAYRHGLRLTMEEVYRAIF